MIVDDGLFIVRQALMSTLTAGVLPHESIWLRLLPIPVQVIDAYAHYRARQNAKEVRATRTGAQNVTGSGAVTGRIELPPTTSTTSGGPP